MANTLIPFSCLFLGDGLTATFVLDTNNDIFTLGVHTNMPNWDSGFQFSRIPNGLNPLSISKVDTQDNLGNNFSASTSINGNAITFKLDSVPASGTIVRVTGYIEFA